MTPEDKKYGPVYPDLGSTVARFRSKARKGVAAMPYEERQAYGAAVEKAILAKQRSELQRVLPSHRVHCASGTDHNTGAEIDAAIKRQQRASLLACPSQIRRARPDEKWKEMYAEAMDEKRKREAGTFVEPIPLAAMMVQPVEPPPMLKIPTAKVVEKIDIPVGPTARQLLDKVKRLRAAQPLSDALASYRGEHKDKWIGWLGEKSLSPAEQVFTRLQNPRMIIWIAEAVGLPRRQIRDAVKQARSDARPAAKTAAVRKIITWPLVAERLFPSSHTNH